ncbi:MAG: hypothetical protein ACHP93_01205 [Solirubrobacterales bacterium]
MTPSEERSSGACSPFAHEAGCLTCGDTAAWMGVLEVDAARELAVCVDEGERRHTVDTGIAGAVAPGDRLLVHAGAALLKESA